MGLIIVTTRTRRFKFAIYKTVEVSNRSNGIGRKLLLSSVLTPRSIRKLLLNQLFQVNSFVKLICFCSWVANKSFRIKSLGNLVDVSKDGEHSAKLEDIPS